LFEQGIVRDLDDMERIYHSSIQDYRGYPIKLELYNFKYFPLSDEILRMKKVNFFVQNQFKPIHKLVSPEPHFVEEERDLIENHFKYLGSDYKPEDVEEWSCFEMDNEGHLVSFFHEFTDFQFSNESIKHLSNFPHLRKFYTSSIPDKEYVTNFSLLSNLRHLSVRIRYEIKDLELFKDLGLFSNLLSLDLNGRHSF